MNRPLTFHGRLPGVVCEIALPQQQVNPLRLDVTAFVGLAERGPLNIPVAVRDIEQYRSVFGKDLPLARMSQGNQIVYANLQRAVQAFFDNGGRLCYVVRVAGANARANLFRIPGLLAWDSNAKLMRQVVVPAAWPGRWSTTIGVGTQLLSQPLPLAKPAIEWQEHDNFVLHLLLPAAMNVQQNDVLRLHFDGPGKPLVYCYVESTQREDDSGTGVWDDQVKRKAMNAVTQGEGGGTGTLWRNPVRVNTVADSALAFTTNIQPLPLAISVGKQQGNNCDSLNVHALRLEELPGLEDGYVLRVPSTTQVKKADVLCIECGDGEELTFPVESISQQASNIGAASGGGDYVLTSRSPTWKLVPTLVQRLTPDGWVLLPALLSGRLEVGMARNHREYRLHLEAEDASKIEIGDVLLVKVTHGGQLLFPVSDVQIPPQLSGASSATSASSQSSSQVSSPQDMIDAQVISNQALWLFSLPTSSGASHPGSFDPSSAVASSSASSASSPPLQDGYGVLQQVDRLTFTLYVSDEEKVVETWNDLCFGQLPVRPTLVQHSTQSQASALTARSWLAVLVPPDDELRKEIAHPAVVQREIPGLDPGRSALLGMPVSLSTIDDGTAAVPLYFPLFMDDLPLPDEFAGPLDSTSAIVLSSGGTDTFSGGTDDLETFEPERLFLDEMLAGFGYRDLINEANAILFASADVEVNPFKGLHSLLFIDEIGIVALPDLPQRGWKRWKSQQSDDQCPVVTDKSPERNWSQFKSCCQPEQPQPQPCVKSAVESVLDLPVIETPDEYNSAELAALMRIQHALVNFCAARGDVLGVLCLPLHFKKREVLDWQERFTRIPDFMDGMPLSYVAVYHPWLKVHEEVPLQTVVSYLVPPDGSVCGMLAARELARGPWIAAANVPLLGVIGLSPVLSKDDWEALFNAQVNLVRQLPGQFTLLSAHTLSLEDTFLQISVRRLLIFLRKLALLRGMRYVFEANNERFRERVQSDLEAALTIMAQRGAICAFEVVTDNSINTRNDYDNGRFIIAIRVAPTLPIEFITVVLLRVGEDLLQVIEG